MDLVEIEQAMEEYAEKAALLPMPSNADEHRNVLGMLGALKASEAAEALVEMHPEEAAARKYRRGLITPHELYVALIEKIYS
jgi:hypothetical protein